MCQAPFAALTRFCVHKCNLLEARMIVTTYNQHVRLLSSELFGWFAPPKFTRAWEPTLLWNHFTHWAGVAISDGCCMWMTHLLRARNLLLLRYEEGEDWGHTT
jgi:hypothetical protein